MDPIPVLPVFSCLMRPSQKCHRLKKNHATNCKKEKKIYIYVVLFLSYFVFCFYLYAAEHKNKYADAFVGRDVDLKTIVQQKATQNSGYSH